MPDQTKPIGVLFMAYGGPESLDEIAVYLSDIRHGRPTTTAVLDEITNNYRQIGGKSPIMGLTQAQIDGAMAASFLASYRQSLESITKDSQLF